MEKTFPELLESAMQLLLDRKPRERDLIYQIAKLDNKERAAIISAYDILKKK